MRTLRFPIAGDNDLIKINEIISFQEGKDCEFLDNKIAYVDNAVVNLVTFKAYDETTEIKKLILQEKSLGSPPNKFWEGVIVASNSLIVVAAGRAD
jgi:hypothetical protein